MNYDEFAFFNQQLAAMLRDGIPLEGALRRLCSDMSRSALRDELQALEKDLAGGAALGDALAARRLPELYKRLALIGVKGGNLPDALTLLADFYHRQNNLWLRLKGLMMYPLIVLLVAFAVSCVFLVLWSHASAAFGFFFEAAEGRTFPAATRFALPLLHNLWLYPAFFGILFLAACAAVFLPNLRQSIRWRLPAFKEASLARFAAAMHLLLRGGVNLPEAIGVARCLESDRAAGADLDRWRYNLSQGISRFSEVAASNRVFPPLFVWLVSQGGEDAAAGFARAEEIYRSRAEHRSEMVLYAVLPVMVVFLGAVILSQAWLLLSGFLVLADLFTSLGS